MAQKKVLVRHYEKSDGTHVRQHTRKQEVKNANPSQEIPEDNSVVDTIAKSSMFQGDVKSNNKKEGKK